jgi:glycosyltransferase involved in cell wall biosynthesis
MRVIMISSDRRIFEERSAVRARMIDFGSIFTELHVIVSTKRLGDTHRPREWRLAPNVYVYATNSRNSWFYVFDTVIIGRRILRRFWPSRITGRLKVNNIVITAQDPFENGLAAFLIARLAKAPFQLQIHTDFLTHRFRAESFLNKIRIWLAKKLLTRASGIRAVSEEIAESVTCEIGVPLERIQILPVFIDAKAVVAEQPVFDLKKRYPEFRFIVVSVGRLEAEKRFDIALDVIAKVKKKYPFTGLIIIGDGRLKFELAKKALALGLDQNVFFESWQDSVISHLKTANALLLTSQYEGFGMVLLEAALCGTPIVSANVGIAGKLYRNGAAIVCPPGDVNAFAAGIIELIENNEGREFMRARAKAFAEELLYSKRKYLNEFKRGLEATAARSTVL